MPGLNRRGPNGEGAMTGRRMGRCDPANKGKSDEEILKNREESTGSESNPQPGLGLGPGLGRGLGRGRGQGIGLGRGQGRGMSNR